MSGVEIVGLVIGVIPLFMGAAATYHTTFGPLVIALQSKRTESKYADFLRDLLFELELLHQILITLQSRLPKRRQYRSDSALGNTVQHDILKDTLGSAYDVFMHSLCDSTKVFNHLVTEKVLDISGSTMSKYPAVGEKLIALELARQRGDSTLDLSQRIRFSMKEARRMTMLQKLSKNNAQMERLLDLKASCATWLANSPSTLNSPPSTVSRDILSRLYDAIASRWYCSISKHQAMMSLRCCCSWLDTKSDEGTELLVVMSTHPSCVRLWQESLFSIKPKSPKLQVKFADDKLKPKPTTRSSQRAPLKTFCPLIDRAQQNRTHLCIEYDGQELWHVSSTASTRPPSVEPSAPRITLNDLLTDERQSAKLKQKQKLSVILARGLLHFGENQWVNEEWNKKHVAFIGKATKEAVDLTTPYLLTGFDASTTDTVGGAEQIFSMHPNSSVLSLGILLLEVFLWNDIERHHTDEDLTDGVIVNVNTNLTTALRVLDTEGDDIMLLYKQAVRACLVCDFAPEAGEQSFDDETFRKGFYDHVISPLEEELHRAWNLKVSDLCQ